MPVASPAARSALLVIDLQIGMFNGERIAPIHAGEALLTNTQAALGHAKRSGARVIYIRHAGPAGHAGLFNALYFRLAELSLFGNTWWNSIGHSAGRIPARQDP
jgi:nicotinamidase-related amidase